MGALHTQTFHIEVFVSGELHQTMPDAVGDMSAIMPQFAVQGIMQMHHMDFAEVVYIRSNDREAWMHEVFVYHDGITYVNPVERSLVSRR